MENTPPMFDIDSKIASSVLMLTTDRQIDRRTLQQADSLTQNGWQVTIIAMPLDVDVPEDSRIVRIKLTNHSQALRHFSLISWYQTIRRYLPMNGVLIKLFRRLAWTYFANPEKLFSNLFANEIKHYSPTVVMAIDLPTLPAAAKHARQCGAKLIYDSHELYSEQEFSKHEKKLWHQIEDKFIHQCHTVITVNPSIAAELKARFALKSIQVIYNSINPNLNRTNSYLFHQAFNLALDKKILLFQGGLSKGRHLETLVRSIKYVSNESIVLVILGDGQFKNTLERLVITLQINNRVYFHSAVPQNELLAYTQAADLGIIPYQAICLNNYYCTPNKLFEFIAAGIPILGNNLPEINDIVVNNLIGLTGDMSSAKQLARLIDDCFSNQERLDTWKKNILKVQTIFSWHNEEQKLLELFEDLVL